MAKRWRRWMALALPAALALTLTACGSDDNGGVMEGPGPTPTTSSAPPTGSSTGGTTTP